MNSVVYILRNIDSAKSIKLTFDIVAAMNSKT